MIVDEVYEHGLVLLAYRITVDIVASHKNLHKEIYEWTFQVSFAAHQFCFCCGFMQKQN